MRSYPVLGVLILLGCSSGHGSLPIALSTSPASSPPQAIACARAKVDTLGYQLTAFDETDFRLTARKNDYNAHRADPKFRRNVDRLDDAHTHEVRPHAVSEGGGEPRIAW